jgi:hypothetical protein
MGPRTSSDGFGEEKNLMEVIGNTVFCIVPNVCEVVCFSLLCLYLYVLQ